MAKVHKGLAEARKAVFLQGVNRVRIGVSKGISRSPGGILPVCDGMATPGGADACLRGLRIAFRFAPLTLGLAVVNRASMIF